MIVSIVKPLNVGAVGGGHTKKIVSIPKANRVVSKASYKCCAHMAESA